MGALGRSIWYACMMPRTVECMVWVRFVKSCLWPTKSMVCCEELCVALMLPRLRRCVLQGALVCTRHRAVLPCPARLWHRLQYDFTRE
eukprot:1153469-Pelagomonas_calceolata.AAC.1